MYGKLFNRLTFSATRKVAVGGAGIVGAGVHVGSNPSFSEVGLRNQPVARTVYSAQLLDEECDDSPLLEVNAHAKSSSDKERLFDTSLIREEVQREPVQEVEADCAMEVFFSSPEMVDSVVNAGMRPGQVRGALDLEQVIREVRSIVTNKQLIQSVCQKIEERKSSQQDAGEKKKKKTEQVSDHTSALAEVAQSSSQQTSAPTAAVPLQETKISRDSSWEDLAAEFPCAICLDVCAAPHLLECQHTFCWECLHGLKSACESQDPAVEVVHSCPECRSEFTTAIFEMRYDECIRKRVEAFPDCPQKEHWAEKRKSYEERDRIVETKCEDRKCADESPEDDLEDDWGLYVRDYVVPAFVVTVLLLVISCRHS